MRQILHRHGSEPLDLRPNCNGESEMAWSLVPPHGSVISGSKRIHPSDYDGPVIHPGRQVRACDYQDMDPMSPATPRSVMGLPKSLTVNPAMTPRYPELRKCSDWPVPWKERRSIVNDHCSNGSGKPRRWYTHVPLRTGTEQKTTRIPPRGDHEIKTTPEDAQKPGICPHM